MLRNALDGSEGSASSAAYVEAFRIIMRTGVGDKSLSVRIAAARCLKAFANIGGPSLGIGELENCLSYCVKVSIINEQIEETLFHMLDEETDTDIGNLARTTIMRLLYASCPSRPSRWLSICHDMILSTSSRHNAKKPNKMENDSSTGLDGDKGLNLGEDDENMVSSAENPPIRSYTLDYTSPNFSRDKHLRYRTRVFAAECLNHLPEAVGENPSHFDLSLAKGQPAKGPVSGDWLVLQLQDLISLAYQISTIQFEKMRPIGVSLLCTIMDKFAAIPDPELPDHLLLEQYQAQLVSAVRSALDSSSGPILLEAGLQLATKMLTSGIISRDQVAVKRIFSLISRPLSDFNELYYPSYAEWVSCKIKVRLLTVHASLKCYVFESLRRQGDEISDEYLALLPLFAKSSSILGAYWLSFLKDYIYIRFHLRLENWKPFLDGIQSSVVSVELQPCLEEAWLVILQALVLDAVPAGSCVNESSPTDSSRNIPTSGYSMVELQLDDFQFLWGFLLMLLFQEQDVTLGEHIIPMCCIKSKFSSDISVDDSNSVSSNILFPVFQFMSTERFFSSGFLTVDACSELLQVGKLHGIVLPSFFYHRLILREVYAFGNKYLNTSQSVKIVLDSWALTTYSELKQDTPVVQNCPKDFLNVENFAYLAAELCVTYLFKLLLSDNVNSQHPSGWENSISAALTAASTLLERSEAQMQLKLLLPFLLVGYKCIGEASTEISLSRIYDFVQSIASLLKRLIEVRKSCFTSFYSGGKSEFGADDITHLLSITRACLNATVSLTNDCVQAIHQLENKRSRLHKMLLLKLAYSVEQFFSYATLAFVFEGPGENQESNPLLSRGLHLSIQCIESVLTDSDIQIQAIGLQVVKVMLQKGLGAEFNAFLIFFVVELLEGLFSIVRNILEEANDLRNVAVILVSQLAQIPSSAASIKDILLAMPVGQRQQLQDIIRASVNQDKDPKPLSSPGPPLSFPASGSETIPAPESRECDYEESSASLSLSNKESLNVEDHELGEAASAFHEADSGNQMEESDNPEDGSNIGKQSDEIVPDLAAEELPNIQSDEVAEEHTEPFANYFEKSEMVPSHENDQPLPDVQHISSTAEHQTETSHDYEQGLPDLQPMEFSQEHAQPSTEKSSMPYDEGRIFLTMAI
ncbi:protein SWEETIE [Sesamum angolense]|uniref:Protein SWEETIE n=1 Tax=Sesamum angolense TaxID=2727404 RepID=A0AAE1WHR1_9LAMI|nr:protein SWEETIE [Sesamum angolense]